MPLLVRTLSLRAILMIATAVAARLGDADIAAHQIILSLWSLLAFALDAIAIAGQAIIGRYLGAGDAAGARDACRRMVQWGIAAGVVLGLLVVITRPLFLPLFTSDTVVQDAALPALLMVALSQPICGIVFILDGVLMGAGDVGYLRTVTIGSALLGFLPLSLLSHPMGWGLAGVWTGLDLFIALRLVAVLARVAGRKWLSAGVVT